MATTTSTDSKPVVNIRNVCILAHVDHGKSSYADSLLAANNIISPRLAGKLRYLDSRPDEQERGITMKSSAVSLSYKILRKAPDGTDHMEDYIINLIDTPGHVDFTSEVSTASRLCDGALILVDVVEGVCTQTINVLRQAWNEQLKPILVINKMDRLITELRLSPTEAYYHLVRLVEQVNAVMGSFFVTQRMEQDLKWREAQEKQDDNPSSTKPEEFQETDDTDLYFNPAKGDVLFSSAIDNWSFTISKFSHIWSKKLGIKEDKLERCLWGDFFFDQKTKMVLTKKQLNGRPGLKPMFVQFILDNLWAVYDAVILNPDLAKTQKIINSLEIKIRPQELKSKDTKNLLGSICSQWLPISTATFRTIVTKIPDPLTSQSLRLPKILHPHINNVNEVVATNPLEKDLYSGRDSDDAHVVIYVSKMFAVPTNELPQFQRRQLTANEMREQGRQARANLQSKLVQVDGETVEGDSVTKILPDSSIASSAVVSPPPGETLVPTIEEEPTQESPESSVEPPISDEDGESLIGFARIYSGTVKVNQKLTCVLPRYNEKDTPKACKSNTKEVTIENLYMIMGRSLTLVNEVKAGHVFGIGGLAGKVLRNATLCGRPLASNPIGDDTSDTIAPMEPLSSPLINLAGVRLTSTPMVRVTLEPKQPSDMPKLVEGLKLLNQSDPCVETLIQDTGEHVILTSGEVHLERCLSDLRERFAKIKIHSSKPIVPFRETAIRTAEMVPSKNPDQPRGTVSGSVSNGLITYTIRAVPLPDEITDYLIKSPDVIRNIAPRHRADQTKKTAVSASKEEIVSTDEVDDLSQTNLTDDDHISSLKAGTVLWNSLDKLHTEYHSNTNDEDLKDFVENIWAFGPRRTGPNVLLDQLPRSNRSKALRANEQPEPLSGSRSLPVSSDIDSKDESNSASINLREFDESIETAFQLTTLKGPLCAEPLSGMSFSIQSLELDTTKASVESIRSRWSQLTGELISSLQESMKSAMLDWSPRLLLATYTCEIQATTDVLGKVYAVVSRRKGTIISEEIKDGTTFYSIKAILPIIESFGFNDELMSKTSGIALPQLIFDGFKKIDQDPFWIPKTDEELEDFGQLADKENLAKKYIESVRKRKGMFVEKKIVQHAEKQRTLKR
ncbi:hypothetical protein DFH28DRAFT_924919 [Melampsora americana]|nr:hypothetical protein DFH28DRAFT_924919 [Melampsora americana]